MRRILFNPGPTNTRSATRQALITEDMSHRAPEFSAALIEVRSQVVAALGGSARYGAVLFAASGTGANEAVLNAVQGPVLSLVKGRYSERMAQIAERGGHRTHRLTFEPFGPLDLALVAAELRARPEVKTLTFVHHETTTGVLAPYAELCALASEHGVATVVDAISSVGAHYLDLDATGPDWVTVSANKGFEGLPGVSFVVARTELLDAASTDRSLYFDVGAEWRAQNAGQVRFTLPVQVIFALRAALRELDKETPLGRAARYRRLADRMRAGLTRRGFNLVELPEPQRSNVVIPVHLPPRLDFTAVRDRLEELGIEVYSASEVLDAGYFFLATMGALEETEIESFLDTFASVCAQVRAQVPGAAKAES